MPRAKTKTMVATIKLTPQCRVAWEAVAMRERRSLSNMFEVAIFAYCERQGIALPPPSGKVDARSAGRKALASV